MVDIQTTQLELAPQGPQGSHSQAPRECFICLSLAFANIKTIEFPGLKHNIGVFTCDFHTRVPQNGIFFSIPGSRVKMARTAHSHQIIA